MLAVIREELTIGAPAQGKGIGICSRPWERPAAKGFPSSGALMVPKHEKGFQLFNVFSGLGHY